MTGSVYHPVKSGWGVRVTTSFVGIIFIPVLSVGL